MNRIEYITAVNPKGVKQVINKLGYECPEQMSGITRTMKLIIRKHGKPAIKALLEVHPDRQAILSMKKPCKCELKEDHFCGCQTSNYVGQEMGLDALKSMNLEELESYYETVVAQSNKNPGNTRLAEQVQLIWKILSGKRKEAAAKPKSEENGFLRKVMTTEWMIAGGILTLGILLGRSFKNA